MPRKPLSPKERKTYKGQKISEFCLNVQKRRLEVGMSQAELAEELGIARPRISELESGRFPEDPDRIVAIAHALKVDINWLFGFTIEPKE
ncbi:MAG: helix-turn-helix transcriptional regulator [Planctomycetes bacterium]|nr:helix-turn-helix transcriptional regulator [Planctomycetota bacterium]